MLTYTKISNVEVQTRFGFPIPSVLTNMACISQCNYCLCIFYGKWKLILMKLYIPLIPKESFGLSGKRFHFDFELCWFLNFDISLGGFMNSPCWEVNLACAFFWLYLDDFNLLTNDKVSWLSKIICWFGRTPMLSLWSTGSAWLLQVCLDLVLLDQLDTSGMWILFCAVYLAAFQSCLYMVFFLLISDCYCMNREGLSFALPSSFCVFLDVLLIMLMVSFGTRWGVYIQNVFRHSNCVTCPLWRFRGWIHLRDFGIHESLLLAFFSWPRSLALGMATSSAFCFLSLTTPFVVQPTRSFEVLWSFGCQMIYACCLWCSLLLL